MMNIKNLIFCFSVSAGIICFFIYFLIINQPLFIIYENNGSMTGKAPLIILLPDKNIYYYKIVNDKMEIFRCKIPDKKFYDFNVMLEKYDYRIEPYYVFEYGYDYPDVAIYLKTKNGYQTTYIYPYVIEAEKDKESSLEYYKRQLKETAGVELVKIIESSGALREVKEERSDLWNIIVYYWWINKLPKIWIEEIRNLTTAST